MAAMSFLVHLTPAEALPRLEERAHHLENEIALRSAGVSAASAHVLRINLVESEYLIAMLKAELAWVRSLVAEISTGNLSWDLKSVLKVARAFALKPRAPRSNPCKPNPPRQHEPASASPDSLSRPHLDAAHPCPGHRRSPQRLHAPQHPVRTHP